MFASDFADIVGVKVWYSGLIEVVWEPKFNSPNKPETRDKTSIERWSKKSQRRLLATMAKSSVTFGSMMVLTFPDRMPITDGKVAKTLLNRFLVRLRRKYPDVEYVWVQEWQKNGQPHFHLITNIGDELIDRQWLGSNWSQAILKNPPETWSLHKLLADDIYKVHSHKKQWEPLRSPDGAQRYLLSYISKVEQKTPPKGYVNVGRFWGASQGVLAETDPNEEWPIDESTLRKILGEWGLEWVAGWQFLPKYIHTTPLEQNGVNTVQK